MLAAQIEARLGSGEGSTAKGPDMKVWSKGKNLENVCYVNSCVGRFLIAEKIDWPSVEFCYPPIIISKSSKSGYDLRYTVESSDDNIAHKGVFLVAFGIRYRSYSTNIGRTFIVDPNQVQCFIFKYADDFLNRYCRNKRRSITYYYLYRQKCCHS